MSVFKNFQIGGGRRIQFRWEIYNVFNQVNWSAINTNAQFNPAGAAGQRELRPGDRGAQRARHAGGDPVHLLNENRLDSPTASSATRRSIRSVIAAALDSDQPRLGIGIGSYRAASSRLLESDL